MGSKRLALTASAGALLMVLTGCEGSDQHRSATAETAVSKAVITTQIPADALSDEQLQAIANGAADAAASMPSAGQGPEALGKPQTLEPEPSAAVTTGGSTGEPENRNTAP